MKKLIFILPLLSLFAFAPERNVKDSALPDMVVIRGVFAEGVECPGIRTCDNSAFYTTSIPAGYAIGDEVFVVGSANSNIISFCMQGPHLGILHIHRAPCR